MSVILVGFRLWVVRKNTSWEKLKIKFNVTVFATLHQGNLPAYDSIRTLSLVRLLRFQFFSETSRESSSTAFGS